MVYHKNLFIPKFSLGINALYQNGIKLLFAHKARSPQLRLSQAKPIKDFMYQMIQLQLRSKNRCYFPQLLILHAYHLFSTGAEGWLSETDADAAELSAVLASRTKSIPLIVFNRVDGKFCLYQRLKTTSIEKTPLNPGHDAEPGLIQEFIEHHQVNTAAKKISRLKSEWAFKIFASTFLIPLLHELADLGLNFHESFFDASETQIPSLLHLAVAIPSIELFQFLSTGLGLKASLQDIDNHPILQCMRQLEDQLNTFGCLGYRFHDDPRLHLDALRCIFPKNDGVISWSSQLFYYDAHQRKLREVDHPHDERHQALFNFIHENQSTYHLAMIPHTPSIETNLKAIAEKYPDAANLILYVSKTKALYFAQIDNKFCIELNYKFLASNPNAELIPETLFIQYFNQLEKIIIQEYFKARAINNTHNAQEPLVMAYEHDLSEWVIPCTGLIPSDYLLINQREQLFNIYQLTGIHHSLHLERDLFQKTQISGAVHPGMVSQKTLETVQSIAASKRMLDYLERRSEDYTEDRYSPLLVGLRASNPDLVLKILNDAAVITKHADDNPRTEELALTLIYNNLPMQFTDLTTTYSV